MAESPWWLRKCQQMKYLNLPHQVGIFFNTTEQKARALFSDSGSAKFLRQHSIYNVTIFNMSWSLTQKAAETWRRTFGIMNGKWSEIQKGLGFAFKLNIKSNKHTLRNLPPACKYQFVLRSTSMCLWMVGNSTLAKWSRENRDNCPCWE